MQKPGYTEEKKPWHPSRLRCQHEQPLHRAGKHWAHGLWQALYCLKWVLPQQPNSTRNGLQRGQKEEWSGACWTKRKSRHQEENVWPLARPLVIKSMLTISPCKFGECMFPLDNIFMAKKILPQKINMFQRKFEWSFNRSHLCFCERKRNAAFKQYKWQIYGKLQVFLCWFFVCFIFSSKLSMRRPAQFAFLTL